MASSIKATLAEIRAEAELAQLQLDVMALERDQKLRDGCPKGWSQVDHENRTRPRKVHVTLRLDGDMAKWFWQQGEGYQARMNAVLRCYMMAKIAKKIG